MILSRDVYTADYRLNGRWIERKVSGRWMRWRGYPTQTEALTAWREIQTEGAPYDTEEVKDG